MVNIVFAGTFLDVNDFPGIIKGSNLFLRHPNTSVDVVEGLEGALRNKSRNTSRSGRPGGSQNGSKSCFLAHFCTLITLKDS